ncbi:NAD(P)H-quinone oxidoreductase [Ornithinimicrobium pratense]|uniref:NAD(P)H-quinone oxidoreductase n=1 Tax=Ornithinimicrobium pratense TaxID=2593973 RepID=A0A5J6V8C9_9MICO|nr:NAD(P)H-quinone oxidoreductase [Ornithinimicrobium pratense]QFG69827.1 NAD(P)H-quinone oxidoreductase [Ornithinimicrobium pratense]
MRAITIPEPGEADALVIADVPTPEPGQGEVLVEVVAAGVNRADVMQRKGFYPAPPGESELPGLEVSGRITALGPGTESSGWSVGDEVCALLAGGGYAESVTVPAGQLLPVPAGVELADAAALPEVACTVWSNLVMEAGLKQGETVLLHGGSSGIGTMAIQVARELGTRIAVTAGSADKLAACQELGAQILVNYREDDFVEIVKQATDGHGADVILDVVGAKYLPRNVKALAKDGRLVVIGLLGGRTGELDLGALLAKRGRVIATSLRSRSREDKARIVAQVREHVWPMVEDGRVRPLIQSRHRLEDAAEAHREMEASGHIGKILLDVSRS